MVIKSVWRIFTF